MEQEEREREPPAPDRRALGATGERLAAQHLERLGFEILARNVRSARGEIDLIAFDGETLVFAEVKTRRWHGRRDACRAAAPEPLELLLPRQRARIRRLAAAWLASRGERRPRARRIRFDAVGVVLDRRGALLRLEHLEDAW